MIVNELNMVLFKYDVPILNSDLFVQKHFNWS